MPLDASVTRFIGRRVQVVTVPGHGWIDKDHNLVAPLPAFFVTISRFWSFRGNERSRTILSTPGRRGRTTATRPGLGRGSAVSALK